MPAIVLDRLVRDVRVAARMLARERGFAATAVLVLGLGIGVNTMLFTVLNAHTIRGLPIADAGRVVYVSSVDDRRTDRGLSYPDFLDLQAARSVAPLAAFVNAPVVVGDEGTAPDRLDGAYVTANAFAAVGITPLRGRSFAVEDDRAGAPPVVMLGAGAWAARYAGDPAVVGRPILVNGAPATVIGIVPARSGFPSTAEVWLPLSSLPGLSKQPRDARTLRVVGRLAAGATVASARAELESIAARLAGAYPATNAAIGTAVVPINERFLGRLGDPAWRAFMAVGFLVVLISCANVANLLLDRAVRRGREVAIRTSLGAARRRVVMQLLTEAGLLAALGGALGLALAMLGVRLFRAAIPATALPYWMDYSLDVRVIAVLAGVSLTTVFVFGLVPAIGAAKIDVVQALKDGGMPAGGGRGIRRWSTAFLVAELALTVVMLANLALGLRLGRDRVQADAALDSSEVLTASMTLSGEAYRTPVQRGAFYRSLDERLAATPGVIAAALAGALPRSGAQERQLDRPSQGTKPPSAWTLGIGPRYFETLGFPIVRGREFGASDTAGVAIVNQRLVELYFADRDPVGEPIALGPAGGGAVPSESFVIVGVAPAIRQRAVPEPDPMVYLPLAAAPPTTASLLVRGRGDAAALSSTVRGKVAELDRNLPLYRLRTLAGAVADAQWNARIAAGLLTTLTILALLLSTVGLAAVTAQGVSQRTREIGVRMALGARTVHVLRLILRRAAVQLVLGFGAGIACTAAWGSVFASGDPDALVTDPRVLGFIVVALIGAGALACAVPARRAARLDPVMAIRRS